MIHRPFLSRIAIISMLGAFAQVCCANIVSNGGFELPALAASTDVYAAGSGSLPNWTISGTSGIDHVRSTFWQSAEGIQSISLNWTSPSAIEQTLVTVPNQKYLLTFSLAAERPTVNATIRTIDILWGGNTVDSLSINPAGNTDANMGWQIFSYIVTGTGSDALKFASTVPGGYGPTLDGVSVNPIPLPASIALLSFAAAGLGMIRRRKPN